MSNACNCGIVGFNNQELKDKYISKFEILLNELQNSNSYISVLNNDSNLCPNIVIEQKLLYDVSKNYKVKSLLGKHWDTEQAKLIKYCHVCGSQKYSDENMSEVKRTLKELFPEIYKKLIEIYGNN